MNAVESVFHSQYHQRTDCPECGYPLFWPSLRCASAAMECKPAVCPYPELHA